MNELQDYPDCFLCGKECDENYTIIDNEYVCTECNNSEDNKYHYGSIENLVKDIKQHKKKCFVCKNNKNITEFYKNKLKSDGYSNICKSCEKERKKEYQKTEKYKEYQKEYQKSDKRKEYEKSDKRKERKKEYEKSDKRKERKKEYRKTEKYKEYQKKYRKSDKHKELKKEYRKSGKHKNLDSYFKYKLKKKGFSKEQINENTELINIQKLIIKTKRLCKTSAN